VHIELIKGLDVLRGKKSVAGNYNEDVRFKFKAHISSFDESAGCFIPVYPPVRSATGIAQNYGFFGSKKKDGTADAT